MPNLPRPTSPHISIYRPQISSVLSIVHRITGVALYAGTALLVIWLWNAAYAPSHYAALHACLTSVFGQLLLFGWTLAFFYHFANGVRHLFWDIGKGFALPHMAVSGWLVLLFTILMAGFTWGFILSGAHGYGS